MYQRTEISKDFGLSAAADFSTSSREGAVQHLASVTGTFGRTDVACEGHKVTKGGSLKTGVQLGSLHSTAGARGKFYYDFNGMKGLCDA